MYEQNMMCTSNASCFTNLLAPFVLHCGSKTHTPIAIRPYILSISDADREIAAQLEVKRQHIVIKQHATIIICLYD